MLSRSDRQRLIALARGARENAYAPYSKFFVGAALLTASGTIFDACNVENSSYGLSICAERSAIFQAVAAGEKTFAAIAIVAESKTDFRPCGACLQIMAEFAPNLRILLANGSKVEEFTLPDLLPKPFQLKR